MTAYLLDTNHASPLVTQAHPLRERVLQRLNINDTFAICVPVLAETIFGLSRLPRAAQNRIEWARLQAMFTCYIPDETDAVLAAELQVALRRNGRQLATIDALIATVALRYNLILLTTDSDFESIPELKRENWL